MHTSLQADGAFHAGNPLPRTRITRALFVALSYLPASASSADWAFPPRFLSPWVPTTCFLLFCPSQSASPSKPSPSLTTWAGQPESCPSRRGHRCCFTSGPPMTGGKAGTTAPTDSSPISTSWSKTRTLGPLHLQASWLLCGRLYFWLRRRVRETHPRGRPQRPQKPPPPHPQTQWRIIFFHLFPSKVTPSPTPSHWGDLPVLRLIHAETR